MGNFYQANRAGEQFTALRVVIWVETSVRYNLTRLNLLFPEGY